MADISLVSKTFYGVAVASFASAALLDLPHAIVYQSVEGVSTTSTSLVSSLSALFSGACAVGGIISLEQKWNRKLLLASACGIASGAFSIYTHDYDAMKKHIDLLSFKPDDELIISSENIFSNDYQADDTYIVTDKDFKLVSAP